MKHPLFQRLTRIKQLGLTNVVYPGAQHTRFQHSLGAFHLTSEAILSLTQKGVFIFESEAEAVQAAILMHDIGHGPFSHVLENTLIHGISHEEISLMMMNEINHDLGDNLTLAIKIFKDEYALEGVEVLHYTQFIKRLVDEGKLKLTAGDERIVYHDPCELGRGCGVYKEPREILAQAGTLVKAAKEGDESICCGGSLGSLTLDSRDRAKITESSVGNLLVNNPQTIVTACPLCLKTFSESVPETVKVQDFAETVSRHL